MKYYIKQIDTQLNRVYYKRYKCSWGWTPEAHKDICWKFSKGGAMDIVKRLRECSSPWIKYEIEEVQE